MPNKRVKLDYKKRLKPFNLMIVMKKPLDEQLYKIHSQMQSNFWGYLCSDTCLDGCDLHKPGRWPWANGII